MKRNKMDDERDDKMIVADNFEDLLDKLRKYWRKYLHETEEGRVVIKRMEAADKAAKNMCPPIKSNI